MKESKLKSNKPAKQPTKWVAADPDKFKSNFNNTAPSYDDLCKGDAVVLDLKNKMVKYWINNKFIVKEN